MHLLTLHSLLVFLLFIFVTINSLVVIHSTHSNAYLKFKCPYSIPYLSCYRTSLGRPKLLIFLYSFEDNKIQRVMETYSTFLWRTWHTYLINKEAWSPWQPRYRDDHYMILCIIKKCQWRSRYRGQWGWRFLYWQALLDKTGFTSSKNKHTPWQ